MMLQKFVKYEKIHLFRKKFDLIVACGRKWVVVTSLDSLVHIVLWMMCCIPLDQPWTKLKLFHGCSNKNFKKSRWRKQRNNCCKNSNYSWLFGYLMEEKITVELWEYETWVGQCCKWESAKYMGEGGGGVISHLCQIFVCLLFTWKKEHF